MVAFFCLFFVIDSPLYFDMLDLRPILYENDCAKNNHLLYFFLPCVFEVTFLMQLVSSYDLTIKADVVADLFGMVM